jgi:hypothetical protein
LPHELDTDKLAEAALAILSLTIHDDGRVWKGLDWDLMDSNRSPIELVACHTRQTPMFQNSTPLPILGVRV